MGCSTDRVPTPATMSPRNRMNTVTPVIFARSEMSAHRSAKPGRDTLLGFGLEHVPESALGLDQGLFGQRIELAPQI